MLDGRQSGCRRNRHYPMKVKRIRPGHTLRCATYARAACLAGLTLLITAASDVALAQSAGMAHLLHTSKGQSSSSAQVGNGQASERGRSSARRPDKAESERDMADRATRQGQRGGNPRLSPDERKTLRKNLYDLSREMYQGG
ncbi:MAG TPA: hypothetical protein DC084_00260 [Cupriavidus sp.]|nr:hypothetical protein [Cupriavidus sp.]HBO78595.1 hypothetical protein [Cupriavidus sp.]